jgi:hypothetical protein
MIVNLARRDGDTLTLERIDGDLFFEGGDAQIGVLATFMHGGEQVTGRIVNVVRPLSGAPGDGEPVVDIELVDVAVLDAEAQITLANLPPDNDPKLKI